MANKKMEDWRNASKSFQKELTLHGKAASKAAVPIVLKAAEDFLKSAETQPKSLVPYYTGNLMDSIGVRVLNGNHLAGYRTMVDTTTQHAMKPQRMKGVKGDIWGEVELMSRILRGSRRSGTGLAVQLMIGVPYATNVGFDSYTLEAAGGLEINREYSQELFGLFQSKIETYMKLLEKYPDIKVVV
jgi:hypothetical protein